MNKTIFMLIFLVQILSISASGRVPFLIEEEARFNSIETLSDTEGIQVPSGEIIVGDASGNANAVAMSGDTTISNAGVIAIGAVKVTNAMLAGSITEAKMLVQTADGLHLKRVARATLDCGASSCVAGTLSMGVALPAKALLLRAWYFTEVQFVDGGAGTVALECEDSGNIDAAADITGIAVGAITQTDIIAGAEVAAIAATCNISAVIAVAEQTAGVLQLFVEYVVHD